MKVFKYEIPMPDEDYISNVLLPADAEPVSVGLQNDQMVIWAKVSDFPDKNQARPFVVANTGKDFPYCKGKFVGTIVASTGVVWHVFELNHREYEMSK